MAGDPKVTPALAARYDSLMPRLERRWFPDTRAWVCGRAHGHTLELAVGTGLNLPHYPAHVTLTAIDASQPMLDLAVARAERLGREVALGVGDLADLPFEQGSFDSVVCTFALCEVPDVDAALAEALRVLRPGGSLLLADHVSATNPLLRAGQRVLEWITVPTAGEHYTRRPRLHLDRLAVPIVASERLLAGAIEQLHARRPHEGQNPHTA